MAERFSALLIGLLSALRLFALCSVCCCTRIVHELFVSGTGLVLVLVHWYGYGYFFDFGNNAWRKHALALTGFGFGVNLNAVMPCVLLARLNGTVLPLRCALCFPNTLADF